MPAEGNQSQTPVRMRNFTEIASEGASPSSILLRYPRFQVVEQGTLRNFCADITPAHVDEAVLDSGGEKRQFFKALRSLARTNITGTPHIVGYYIIQAVR